MAEEASREETSGTDNEKNEEITDFEEEMLVMLLADNRILDKLLFQMKKEKVRRLLGRETVRRMVNRWHYNMEKALQKQEYR